MNQPADFNSADDWPDDPIALFSAWYTRAAADGVPEPDTMALATTTSDGQPSVRYVFLRGWDERGFCFFTNYESRKGRELSDNPRAATVFYWRESYRQVRVSGPVEKVTAAESDAYFESRDRSKRSSAIVSRQSRPISDWCELREAADQLHASDDPLSRPAHWGGYRILPEQIEFWLGSFERMHRRCVYAKDGDQWTREMLAP